MKNKNGLGGIRTPNHQVSSKAENRFSASAFEVLAHEHQRERIALLMRDATNPKGLFEACHAIRLRHEPVFIAQANNLNPTLLTLCEYSCAVVLDNYRVLELRDQPFFHFVQNGIWAHAIAENQLANRGVEKKR